MKFTRPPYVVVDTTEFRADLNFGTRWTATLSAGSYGVLNLRIPDVVRREAIRHHNRIVSDGEREALKGLNVVRRYADWPEPGVDPREITRICDGVRAGFPYLLDRTVRQGGGSYMDMPQVDHSTLVERAMLGKKPFDSNGKEGYRDALIWYSILELCGRLSSDDYVLFVTGNSRDFCDDKTGVLAGILRDELSELSSSPVVTVFPTLQAMHGACADALTALTPPPNRPPRYAPAPPNLDVLVDQIGGVCEALIGLALPSTDMATPFDEAGLPIGLGDVFVRDIEEIGEPEMGMPITPIIDDIVTCEVIQPAFVVLEGTMNELDIQSYPGSEVDELSVVGSAAVSGVVHVRFTRVALLTFQVTYDVLAGPITQTRLADVAYAPAATPPADGSMPQI